MQIRIAERIYLDGDVPKAVTEALIREFTYPNPAWGKMQALGFKARIPRYLVSWREWKLATATRVAVGFSIPRGGYERMCRVLAEVGVESEGLIDARQSRGVPDMPVHQVALYDYQSKLVETALCRMQSQPGTALWRSPQASGKTTAGLAFLSKLKQKSLVIVANSVLFRQWQDRVRAEMGFEAGQIGGGRFYVDPPIVIGMQQSLRKVSNEVLGLFGAVLADELQLFAAETFQQVLDRIPAAYRLGVSGDERRADRKECLIYDQFGPVTSEVKAETLMASGKIHEVEVRVVFSEFECPWWTGIDDMQPLPRETKQELMRRKIKHRMELTEHLNEEIGKNAARNALCADLALEAVTEAGNCVVLSTRRDHCHALDQQVTERGLRSGLLIGGDDYRDQFDMTLRQFRAREINVVVGTYQAIGVGFDLPAIARGVCAMPVANSNTGRMQWQQYRGRFARTAESKQDAAIYYVLDRALYGIEPLRHLMRWNSRVVVRDGGQWITAKEYLTRKFHETTQRRSECHNNTNRTSEDRDGSSRFGGSATEAIPTANSDGTLGIKFDDRDVSVFICRRRGRPAPPTLDGFAPAVNGRNRSRPAEKRSGAIARPGASRLDQPATTGQCPRRRRRIEG